MTIPLLQGAHIGKIGEIMTDDSCNTGRCIAAIVQHPGRRAAADDELVFNMKILAQDRSGRDRIAVADLQRADHAALPSQENRLLIQQHPAWHIPDQRRSRFVAVRRKVKMNIGAADLAVVAAAGAAGHQTVAKIDQAAQGHERKQNGLFQPDAVCAGGFLLQNTGLAHLRARPHAGFLQKHRVDKRTALQLNLRPDLAVINRYRAFAPENGTG